ncbi:MAG: chromosomal replication initiator protein DnaA [Bacteriovoracia bacterium]
MRTSLEQDSSKWPEVWQAAYRIMEQNAVESQLKAWIQPLEFQKTEENLTEIVFHLSAANDFTVGWVRDNYRNLIESALVQVTGKPCRLELTAGPKVRSDLNTDLPPAVAYSQPPTSSPLESTPEIARGVVLHAEDRRAFEHLPIDARYTFENFVIGNSNQFAHASAVAVAEKPGAQYNPLFIYSPPGLGKTHLLHAVANHVTSHNPKARVAYLSAESFVNELIDSLQHQRMPQFRKKYRDSYDVLLIDDIQFIAGKKQTEEEFFHTFNALYGAKRQIVVTSDRPPKEIEKLEERIRTRFEWGLVSDINPPEIETRIAILKAKAERDDIYLPDDVAIFLATHIKSNVRELEGILIRLQAQSSLTGAEISLEMAKQEIKASIPEKSSQITIETIQNVVAKHYHIRVQDLKSTSRAQKVAMPRQIAMYLIRKYTGLGYKEIGNFFGGKDHTTILHACNKIEEGVSNDTEIRSAVEALQNQL